MVTCSCHTRFPFCLLTHQTILTFNNPPRKKPFNSLPNDKFSDWSKLKAFADDKLNLTEKLKLELERVENIVGKGENAGYQHFLLFPQCFQKASILGS